MANGDAWKGPQGKDTISTTDAPFSYKAALKPIQWKHTKKFKGAIKAFHALSKFTTDHLQSTKCCHAVQSHMSYIFLNKILLKTPRNYQELHEFYRKSLALRKKLPKLSWILALSVFLRGFWWILVGLPMMLRR